MHPMITCREFEAFIIDYLEGELPLAKRLLFKAHLAMCSECKRYLKAYQRARELGIAVFADVGPDAPPPADVPDDLVEAVVQTCRGEGPSEG